MQKFSIMAAIIIIMYVFAGCAPVSDNRGVINESSEDTVVSSESPFERFPEYQKTIMNEMDALGYTVDIGVLVSIKNSDGITGSLYFNPDENIQGFHFSCGRYAFVNNDFYAVACADLLKSFCNVDRDDAHIKISNMTNTYQEKAKSSKVFTQGDFKYWLRMNKNDEFEFIVYNSASFKIPADKYADYKEISPKIYNTPTMYASSNLKVKGKISAISDLDHDAYALGKDVTIKDSNNFEYKIRYDFAYFPKEFAKGDLVELYGTLETGYILLNYTN